MADNCSADCAAGGEGGGLPAGPGHAVPLGAAGAGGGAAGERGQQEEGGGAQEPRRPPDQQQVDYSL